MCSGERVRCKARQHHIARSRVRRPVVPPPPPRLVTECAARTHERDCRAHASPPSCSQWSTVTWRSAHTVQMQCCCLPTRPGCTPTVTLHTFRGVRSAQRRSGVPMEGKSVHAAPWRVCRHAETGPSQWLRIRWGGRGRGGAGARGAWLRRGPRGAVRGAAQSLAPPAPRRTETVTVSLIGRRRE